MDYRTGDILAYVGSAGYYRKKSPTQFAPEVPTTSAGSWRQPGSAWKPILYATAIDTERLTAGTVPPRQHDAVRPGLDAEERRSARTGADARVRDALQHSLNIPAIRALQRSGVTTVRKYAVKAGFTLPRAATTGCSTRPAWRERSARSRCGRST